MPQITPIAANSTAPRRVIAPPAQVVLLPCRADFVSGVSVHHAPDSPGVAEQPPEPSAQPGDRVADEPADVAEHQVLASLDAPVPADDDVGDVRGAVAEDHAVHRVLKPATGRAHRV